MSTLKVDTILKRTGTGTITLGQSGDTISIPSGTTLSVSGTATGVGEVNTPAFQSYMSSNQSFSASTYTKVALANEYYDTDNAYDTSTYRFTVPSGKGGKYLFYCMGDFDLGGNNSKYGNLRFMINGGTDQQVGSGNVAFGGASNNSNGITMTRTLTLNAGDYVELFGWQNNGTRNLWNPVFFGGHRLTGV
tara:strand:+ start:549 stop:1121 length:573 start_codon:yes stop_codon:yes gene_type:complete